MQNNDKQPNIFAFLQSVPNSVSSAREYSSTCVHHKFTNTQQNNSTHEHTYSTHRRFEQTIYIATTHNTVNICLTHTHTHTHQFRSILKRGMNFFSPLTDNRRLHTFLLRLTLLRVTRTIRTIRIGRKTRRRRVVFVCVCVLLLFLVL